MNEQLYGSPCKICGKRLGECMCESSFVDNGQGQFPYYIIIPEVTKRQYAKHKVWMSHAKDIAELSTTESRKVGACLVRDNRILVSGYNGVPRNVIQPCPRCSDKTIKSGEHLDRCICVHAELNCIINAAREGINIYNSILYCTTKPCLTCLTVLINAGITEIIYDEEYSHDYPNCLLEMVTLTKFTDIGVF